ncbi:hypothetical protein ACFY5J_25230 [Peribacillus butanolivorans]|uniref:hypothetical protein n=1 Tax=Peribacillus butanolivorans TaxID=421767 RepID=UPI00367C2EEF
MSTEIQNKGSIYLSKPWLQLIQKEISIILKYRQSQYLTSLKSQHTSIQINRYREW